MNTTNNREGMPQSPCTTSSPTPSTPSSVTSLALAALAPRAAPEEPPLPSPASSITSISTAAPRPGPAISRQLVRTLDTALASRLPTYASLSPVARSLSRVRFAALFILTSNNELAPADFPLILATSSAARQLRREAYERASMRAGAGEWEDGGPEVYAAALEFAGIARDGPEARFLAGEAWPIVFSWELEQVGVWERLEERELELEWLGGAGEGWCAVCFEGFGDGDGETPVRLRACGHVLGRRCAVRWLAESNTCVFCRRLVYWYVPSEVDRGMVLAGPDGRRGE